MDRKSGTAAFRSTACVSRPQLPSRSISERRCVVFANFAQSSAISSRRSVDIFGFGWSSSPWFASGTAAPAGSVSAARGRGPGGRRARARARGACALRTRLASRLNRAVS
ncbi:hypothetical protein Zmor_003287 [Zophobas morio]|uniref:Uncharacterized protein n=1 Tax=Zophobas morio TaxID=2755281 RepID=A0AA38HLY2_9CUCU|nr:hypothetical protein Zmor_003287 [Zophobas morio]